MNPPLLRPALPPLRQPPCDGAAGLPPCPQAAAVRADFAWHRRLYDVATFATFDNADVETMQQVLLMAGIPPGHVERIMITVRACQDKELRHEKGASPPKSDYGKQMPLLQNLRDEVRALKEQLLAACIKATEQELITLEEHGKWKQSSKEEHTTLRAKSDALVAVKKHLGAEAKKREAAERAAAAAQQAAQQAADAARNAIEESKMRANTRAKSVRRENDELREQMEALRVSLETEVTRADAAEKRAAAAEMALRVHEPYEEPPPVFASSRVACVRFAKK